MFRIVLDYGLLIRAYILLISLVCGIRLGTRSLLKSKNGAKKKIQEALVIIS